MSNLFNTGNYNLAYYDRQKALDYAKRWAFDRNPIYLNFDELGGDCTNYVSQCLYAGIGEMNYTKDIGWYYNSANDRAAAWTGVEYLYNFLVSNKGPGPRGVELPIDRAVPGDIVQISSDEETGRFTHSPFVISTGPIPDIYNIKIAAHTYDAYNRSLYTYDFYKYRLIHIIN